MINLFHPHDGEYWITNKTSRPATHVNQLYHSCSYIKNKLSRVATK